MCYDCYFLACRYLSYLLVQFFSFSHVFIFNILVILFTCTQPYFTCHKLHKLFYYCKYLKETKSATMNIFQFFFIFFYISFVKVELSYVFTINLSTISENCTAKVNYLIKTGVLVIICVPPIIIDS